MSGVKISFIVPVFNKEEHNTPQILKEYEDKIILKTKINAGVSAARNDGILLAKG